MSIYSIRTLKRDETTEYVEYSYHDTFREERTPGVFRICKQSGEIDAITLAGDENEETLDFCWRGAAKIFRAWQRGMPLPAEEWWVSSAEAAAPRKEK
ncbi:hypothetical protein BH11PLA1_BH11PLA1_14460 [soil metagenome]